MTSVYSSPYMNLADESLLHQLPVCYTPLIPRSSTWPASCRILHRGQQRALPGPAQTSVPKGPPAGLMLPECTCTGLPCLSFTCSNWHLPSFTCPNWHHSYGSSSLGKWQKGGGGRENKFHTHAFGEAKNLTCFNRTCFSGP